MTDQELEQLFKDYRKYKGLAPLTNEEAERIFDEVEEVPLSEERINEILDYALNKDKQMKEEDK